MRTLKTLAALLLTGSVAQVAHGQTPRNIREFMYNGLTCMEETLVTSAYVGPVKELYCGDRQSGRLDIYGTVSLSSNMKPVTLKIGCVYESRGRTDPPWMHRCDGPEPYGRAISQEPSDRNAPWVRKHTEKFIDLLRKTSPQ